MTYPVDDVSAEGLKGTLWRRKKDGVLIRITGHNREFDDCKWTQVVPKGVQASKGDIYAYNLRRLYEFVR